jgi:hypothetical protein
VPGGRTEMRIVRRFMIQRKDGAWFAGRSEERAPLWTEDVQQRFLFPNESDLRAAARELESEGYQIRIVILLPHTPPSR